MYQLISAALMAFLGSALRAAVLKFAVYTVLFLVVTEFIGYAVDPSTLPSLGSVGAMFSGLPSGVLYFLAVFQVPTGISVVLSALATRFLIRRIPFFG